VVQQYVNNVGNDVEVLTADGKKLTGVLTAADNDGFALSYKEKQKVEGKKRPVMVDVTRTFSYGETKWVKAVIKF